MLLEKLMGLMAGKSPGPDNVHLRVLKEVAREITHKVAQKRIHGKWHRKGAEAGIDQP